MYGVSTAIFIVLEHLIACADAGAAGAAPEAASAVAAVAARISAVVDFLFMWCPPGRAVGVQVCTVMGRSAGARCCWAGDPILPVT